MSSLDAARTRAVERERLDPRIIEGITTAVHNARGNLDDCEDLLWTWRRVFRDNANGADRIRADVVRSRDRHEKTDR